MIQERSRSVKSIFTVQRLNQADITVDNGATFFDTSAGADDTLSLQNYQYRVGGRYFPAAPVQCSTTTGSGMSNGGAEAYTELAKALNVLGDYRLSTACNVTRWANPIALAAGPSNRLQNWDYGYSITSIQYSSGRPVIVRTLAGGDTGSACFAAAISLETSNGIEISGLNAEEQSDISFLCNWKGTQVSGASSPSALECYVYYDAMIVLEENNVVKLIQ